MDSSPTLTDFQNVADEDTWVSLNRGSQKEFAYIDDDDAWDNLNESHINTDCRSSQTSSEAENRRGSRQATLLVEGSTKIDMVNEQLPVYSCIICNLFDIRSLYRNRTKTLNLLASEYGCSCVVSL